MLFCEWNNITSFLSQEYVSYLSIKDPFQDIREGYNEEKCVSVWTPGGRKKVLATVSDKNSWDTLTKRCFFPFSCSPLPSQSC